MARAQPRARKGAELIVAAYEGFLELPVIVVLVVLWLLGATLLGATFFAAYSAGESLLEAVRPYL